MKQILAYLRISTSKQEKGSSLEVQKSVILQWALAHGFDLPESNIYSEIESGNSESRPEFNKMRERINSEKNFAHLVVYSIDRLARSVLLGEVVAREVKNQGGSIVSVSQGIGDSTASGTLTRQILTCMAEQERLSILSRTNFGKKQAIKKGKWAGGIAPIGYSAVGNQDINGKGQLSVNSHEAEAVKLMFELKQKNKTFREISDVLQKKGLLSRKGTPFNPGAIKRILDRRAFYTGQDSMYSGIVLEDGVEFCAPKIIEE